MANQTKEKKDLKEELIAYLKSVKLEWGKITWPERRQVFVETCFVVAIVFVFTVAIYLMDLIYKGLFGLIK